MKKVENIVVGSSLTEPSDEAVRAALALAEASGARLHLVHAYPVPVVYGGSAVGVASAQPQLLEAEQKYCRRRLDEQLERLEVDAERFAEITLEVGVPHRLLRQIARDADAELIVVGAAETRGALAPILGSTSERILRHAERPVLVVRERLPVPPATVLAPVDLSALSEESLARGLELLEAVADERAPRVEVLFVLSAAEREGSLHFTPVQVERFAREELSELVGRVDPENAWSLEQVVRIGTPRPQILEELESEPADLVVLGTHGRSGFERFLVGSVAADVARRAPISVMVIPPPASVQEEE